MADNQAMFALLTLLSLLTLLQQNVDLLHHLTQRVDQNKAADLSSHVAFLYGVSLTPRYNVSNTTVTRTVT